MPASLRSAVRYARQRFFAVFHVDAGLVAVPSFDQARLRCAAPCQSRCRLRANVQALFVGQSPRFLSARTQITEMIAGLKLPAVYVWREYTDSGGLMSYGSNLPDIYRQSARLVSRILKGENPADLPFEVPTRYELIVNLRTAKAMGLSISDSFLLLADEVIE